MQQGGSQMLLWDDDLKNSSNLISPWTLGSERLSPPSKRRKKFSHHQAPPFVAGVVMFGESRARQTEHFTFLSMT